MPGDDLVAWNQARRSNTSDSTIHHFWGRSPTTGSSCMATRLRTNLARHLPPHTLLRGQGPARQRSRLVACANRRWRGCEGGIAQTVALVGCPCAGRSAKPPFHHAIIL